MMTLFDRLPFRRKEPPKPKTRLARFALLQEQLIERLGLRPFQAFWRELQSVERFWPVVLPLLAWVGWRTYRTERHKAKKRESA